MSEEVKAILGLRPVNVETAKKICESVETFRKNHPVEYVKIMQEELESGRWRKEAQELFQKLQESERMWAKLGKEEEKWK